MRTVVLLAASVPGLFAQPTIYLLPKHCERCQPCAGGGPAGDIARGSIFTIQGAGFGPADKVEAATFPLDTTLAGVSVRISQGTATLNALPLAVSASAITAVMPSNAPLGLASNEGIPFPNSRRLSGCFQPRSNNEQYDFAAIRQLAKTDAEPD